MSTTEPRVCRDCHQALAAEVFVLPSTGRVLVVCVTCWRARRTRYQQTYRDMNPDTYAKQQRRSWQRKRANRDVEQYRAYWRAYMKRYRSGPKAEKYREKQREWNRTHREKTRAWQIKHEYGLTPSDVAAMLAAQQGACAICERPLGEKFDIDHDHETGAVRGLLCKACNHALGRFEDDTARLMRAIQYLTRQRREQSA